jgi:hypothetical protein
MRIPDFTVSQFAGLNTFIKDTKTLKAGIATDSKNWVTGKFGDHIEVRRGKLLLGQTRQGGGKITGLDVGTRYDGVQVPFFSHGKKLKYYDATLDDTVEIGSDILGAAADGEDVWFAPYSNLAGSIVYAGSPNSGVFKIPVANPGTAVDQAITDFRFGFLKFGQGRSFAGQRNGTTAGNNDKTGMYLSKVDHALLSDFPAQVMGEAYGTGDAVTTTFSHTLSSISAPKTAMYVSVTDGNETFVDDRNGNMVGNKGGTGTVNYGTGAVSVTFATAPAAAAPITCSYYYEDSTSTVLNFDTSSPAAGLAKIYRQDDGGAFMTALPFLDVTYCFHLLKTWALTLALDDTTSTNLPYRAIGIPYPRAAKETPDGILCLDLSNPSDPKVRRLEIGQNTTNLTIVPTSISDALDLSGNTFSYAVAFRWGDYEIICCQESVNGVPNSYNSVMYVRSVFSGAWDKLDYGVTCLAILNGALIGGDSISNNVYTLFSGFDDDEGSIDNHWQDGQLNLGTNNLKRANFMRVQGLIQKDQNIDVSIILDDGTPVTVFTIEGDGSYVDQGINTAIGSVTIGSTVIGGGGEATAHPFDVTFPIHTDIFQYISARFEATDIGFAAINSYIYKDIRDKGQRSLPIKTIVTDLSLAIAKLWSVANFPWQNTLPWTRA